MPESLTLHRYMILPMEIHTEAWTFYADTFDLMNPFAAQRHRFDSVTFDELALDKAVEKHVAFNEASEIVGLSMQTNRLLSWRGISDEFWERRYPQEVAADRFWYVVFVGAAVAGRPHHTFSRLLQEMTAGRRDGGRWGMDFCKNNLDKGILELIKMRLFVIDNRMQVREEDQQLYFSIGFPDKTP